MSACLLGKIINNYIKVWAFETKHILRKYIMKAVRKYTFKDILKLELMYLIICIVLPEIVGLPLTFRKFSCANQECVYQENDLIFPKRKIYEVQVSQKNLIYSKPKYHGGKNVGYDLNIPTKYISYCFDREKNCKEQNWTHIGLFFRTERGLYKFYERILVDTNLDLSQVDPIFSIFMLCINIGLIIGLLINKFSKNK